MDYEKKYKEALKDMRAIYPNLRGDAKLAAEHAFPELRESEDERIRKELLEYIKRNSATPLALYEKFTPEQYISYLEKQEEQKPAEWSDSVAKEMFIKALERAVEQTKKGYELTDCDKHSWWEDFKAYSKIKPAEWSKEDKLHLNNAILATMSDWGVDSCTSRWLKALPERFNLQPKQEWSEEDSKRYISIGTTLETSVVLSKEDYDANMAWLRELVNAKKYSGPRPSWKPSEEQMWALKNAVNKLAKSDVANSVRLSIMYDNLKKL